LPLQLDPPIFAASAGGHLDLLRALAPQILDGRDPVWVTSRSPRGQALRDSGASVELLPEYERSPFRALGNVLAAARLVARRRPRTVVSSGAGVVAPFCLLARLAGARLLYMETMARVRSPSMTARLLSRIADRVIVQWPELEPALPRAVVCRPTLLENLGTQGNAAGAGTFVAVGTHAQPYPRMLEIVRRGIEDGLLPEPVRAQVGPAAWNAAGVRVARYLGPEELEAALRAAAVVVCHGGAGIISSALAAGRTPIVVARRAVLGEHVDDHQLELTRKLADWGLVVAVQDRITAADFAAARRPVEIPREVRQRPSAAQLLREALAP
jgi:UDP-N-acetylglucosamine--N-acetylmuramyl-(pentapeptide) pyrophosphoryl-undecaprenol N-acetylglucosamine transferase